MVNWYRNKAFPWLMKKNIGKKTIGSLRKDILSKAYGNILEIGIGTGINLSLYPQNITEITAIDNWIREVNTLQLKVNIVTGSVTEMSFEDNTFDTVVSTFTFCSIKDLDVALSEIYRVLKPNGQLIFLEHGVAQNKWIVFLQNICNSFFNLFALGCNINRSYIEELKKVGFTISALSFEKGPISPKILAGYIYRGVAKKLIPKEKSNGKINL